MAKGKKRVYNTVNIECGSNYICFFVFSLKLYIVGSSICEASGQKLHASP